MQKELEQVISIDKLSDEILRLKEAVLDCCDIPGAEEVVDELIKACKEE